MSLVALDGMPLIPIGLPVRQLYPNNSNPSIDSLTAAKMAVIAIGQIFTSDGASHTIDTTGSSSIGWRCSSSTFANAGTSLVVGLAAVDTSAGPSGRAVNSSGTITADVGATFTGGGGGITNDSWNESVPTSGTKLIANGDFVAGFWQTVTRGGADSIGVNQASAANNTGLPTVTSFNGASSYTNLFRLPNMVITFSDGAKGYFYGGYIENDAGFTTTWNNGSVIKEYGNLIQIPFPAKIYGLVFRGTLAGDADCVLYSDPLGTPAAQKTVSVDLNIVGSTDSLFEILFPSPFSAAANTPYAAILKPTSATNITMQYKKLNASAHQNAENGGNGYAINRNTGAFAAQNSGLDRYTIGFLAGAFDDGAAGVGGSSAHVIG